LGWRKRQIWFGRVLGLIATIVLRRPLLTHRLKRDAYLQHHLEDWRQLAETLELDWNTTVPWFRPALVRLPAEVEQWIKGVRLARQKVWLWHLGARWQGRRWPTERV